MQLATRGPRLGVENAFVVSLKAAAHAAQGHQVYPFHLGDLNLPTPPNVVAAAKAALDAGKTTYPPNAGIPELRAALADETNRTHGTSYAMENVAVQPGGKLVIGKFLLALMNRGDEVLYPNPGFPIYESMIEFLGGSAVPYPMREETEHFTLDLDALQKAITPRTRLLIFNDLHNPTGAECTPEEMEQLAALVERHDLMVLCDEAYFDIRFEGVSRSLVSLPGMEPRCLILQTFSKKFAMTGWRLGAAIGPAPLIEVIIRLNTNLESGTNLFVQWAGLEGILGDQGWATRNLAILKERRDLAAHLLNSMPGVHCLVPNATFYLYPRVTEAMAAKGLIDYQAFQETLLQETGVAACTRAHFGRPLPGETEHYLRMAYSGIDLDQIQEGLGRMKKWLEE